MKIFSFSRSTWGFTCNFGGVNLDSGNYCYRRFRVRLHLYPFFLSQKFSGNVIKNYLFDYDRILISREEFEDSANRIKFKSAISPIKWKEI